MGSPLPLHFVHGGQHVQQHQLGSLAGRHLASKRRARAGGLSECGGIQDDPFRAVAFRREMSLGTHGNDREIDRAQHLFCHGAEQQLAQPAPAPRAEKNAVRLELADRGGNL